MTTRCLINRMLKKSASFVLGLARSSTGTRPPHHSAARTNLVLLIRRTVRPRGYASGFDSRVALLDKLFEHPAGLFSCRGMRPDLEVRACNVAFANILRFSLNQGPPLVAEGEH